MLKSNLEYERNRYYKLRDEIILICENINNGIEHINDSSIELDKGYIINDKSIFNDKFKTITTDLNSIHEILINTILPTINKKITSLTNEINNIMENKYE